MRTLRPILALLLGLLACGEPDALVVEGGDPNKDQTGSRPDLVPEPGACDLAPDSPTCDTCRDEAFDTCAGPRGECGLLTQGIDDCAAANGCASTPEGWDPCLSRSANASVPQYPSG